MSVTDLREQVTRDHRPTVVCGHRKCSDEATEGHDVFSWFVETSRQVPMHYEVCAKHSAEYFGGGFDRHASERVKRDLVDWATLNGPLLYATMRTYEKAMQNAFDVLASPTPYPAECRIDNATRHIREAMPKIKASVAA